MSNIEQPDYKTVTSKGDIEIRDYPPIILAEVEVSGERKQAITEGFKILADYIFGNNILAQKMETRIQIRNETSEKISMTAPVIQEQYMNKWKVKFVMPKNTLLKHSPYQILKMWF